MQKRNIWLKCDNKNEYQNAVFETENDRVHQLIVDDEEKMRVAKEDSKQYP